MTWLVMGKQKLEDVWDISLGENRLNQVHMGHLTVCINFSVDTMQLLQWTELVSVCLLWLLLYKYIADVHSCYQAGLFLHFFFGQNHFYKLGDDIFCNKLSYCWKRTGIKLDEPSQKTEQIQISKWGELYVN